MRILQDFNNLLKTSHLSEDNFGMALSFKKDNAHFGMALSFKKDNA
jgi:hypothetical protein